MTHISRYKWVESVAPTVLIAGVSRM